MWPLTNEECYVSIDIEADGPIPGTYSMLSRGAAVFDSEGKLIDKWTSNLDQLPDATEHPRTMRWWAAHSTAWEAARANPRAPKIAITEFVVWAEGLRSTVGWPVMVAFPAAFDAMWVEWYCHRFAGASPFRRRCIDLRTLAMVAMGAGYREGGKTTMPQHWREATGTHSHLAVCRRHRAGATVHADRARAQRPTRRRRAGARTASAPRTHPKRLSTPAPRRTRAPAYLTVLTAAGAVLTCLSSSTCRPHEHRERCKQPFCLGRARGDEPDDRVFVLKKGNEIDGHRH